MNHGQAKVRSTGKDLGTLNPNMESHLSKTTLQGIKRFFKRWGDPLLPYHLQRESSYPTISFSQGTFEEVFFFSIGGICDRSQEGTPYTESTCLSYWKKGKKKSSSHAHRNQPCCWFERNLANLIQLLVHNNSYTTISESRWGCLIQLFTKCCVRICRTTPRSTLVGGSNPIGSFPQGSG